MLSQLTTAAFTAVLTLFLVRALGPEEYGLFGLALAINGIAVLFADLGVANSMARFVAERRGERSAVAAVLSDALRLKLGLGLFAAAALAAIAGPIADAYREPDLVWPLRGMALAAGAQALFMFYVEGFVALGRISRNVWINLIESIAESGASITLVVLGAGAAGATFGRAIGYAIGAAAAAVVLARLIGRAMVRLRRRRGEPTRTREIISYAIPLLVTNSAYVLYSTTDVLLVGAILDSEAVGLYSAPLRLVVFLAFIGLAVGYAIAPRLADPAGRPENAEVFRNGLRWLLLLQAALLAPLLVWAEPIVDLLLGGEFGESADVLRWLTPYVFLLGIAPLITTAVNYLGMAARRIPIVLGALALNMAIAAALLPSIGIDAAAMAMSAAYIAYTFGHFRLCTRHVHVPGWPLALTLARSLAAGAAMAGILFAFGTSQLTPLDWLLGGAGGLAAYVLALIAGGELKPRELRELADAARGAVRRIRPGDANAG
ncbi:MAG: oligosaccharide flippase family protein [Actinomycetota bacterium]|nr:oligosaccharide flippase family protein [Actinomycetota bacterium]